MAPCCSNSALQDSPWQQATQNSGSQRHSLQGADRDMLEQDDSKPSCGWNEHVDQTTSPMTNSAQWQTIESFRGDPPSVWLELTTPSLQCGKPSLMEQLMAHIVCQEAQKAQRNQQANTTSQDGMQWAAQATGRIQQTLSDFHGSRDFKPKRKLQEKSQHR